ncbi:FAD-dependent oxidoreductase [Desulfovibrio sp. OttesenSCG-928-O18]|nr:FAD-dependent oxidoreductase [Desulfovibrio sp. OttesenSCG-928-O18]
MKKHFDVIIVGGGPAGLFAAFWLAEHSDLSVALFEKGQTVTKRHCPIPKTGKCVHCKPTCHILSGYGGAGLFSDGKLNFIHKLGKTDLTQFMPIHEAEQLIVETEAVFNRFGMDAPVFPSDMAAAKGLRKEAKKHGIDLLLIRQKHLGSDFLPRHIDGMCAYLTQKGVTLKSGEPVQDVTMEKKRVTGVITANGEYTAKAVILAPGRVGADWVGDIARKFKLSVSQRGIEVGVRVEVHNDIMSDVTDIIYDPTFFVQTSRYDDQTRTFCTNPGGFVTLENYQDFVCVNGHAYQNKKSSNTNFAFLSKAVLTDPVSDNQGYGVAIGKLATLIGGGKPILQRYGDLKRGRRSTWNRISKGYIEPTMLNVTPGDISVAMPERIVNNLCDGLEQLNNVLPGVANEETLLYAPEIKFFATQVETREGLETAVSGLFVAGDGPGVSGNIVSAAATGIIPAKHILAKGL